MTGTASAAVASFFADVFSGIEGTSNTEVRFKAAILLCLIGPHFLTHGSSLLLFRQRSHGESKDKKTHYYRQSSMSNIIHTRLCRFRQRAHLLIPFLPCLLLPIDTGLRLTRLLLSATSTRSNTICVWAGLDCLVQNSIHYFPKAAPRQSSLVHQQEALATLVLTKTRQGEGLSCQEPEFLPRR